MTALAPHHIRASAQLSTPLLPGYPDPTHHLYGALVMARALEVIRQSDDCDVYGDVLEEIGQLAGGLSVFGFERDLLDCVAEAEKRSVLTRLEAWHDRHGWSSRPDECAPTYQGCDAGDEAAWRWLDRARAMLRRHGLVLRGGEIVTMGRV